MVDFLMRYKPAGRFVVDPVSAPSAIVPQTAALSHRVGVAGPPPSTPAAERRTGFEPSALDELLNRQKKAPVPRLHGTRPGTRDPGKEPVKAGLSEVLDGGRQVVVLFTAVNTQRHAVELMAPQVQLGGKRRKGIMRRERWVSAEQLSVVDFRLSRRRIGPGERADGVVVFERPSYQHSRESVFLQVAESGAVDKPALAPIGFGSDSIRKGGAQ